MAATSSSSSLSSWLPPPPVNKLNRLKVSRRLRPLCLLGLLATGLPLLAACSALQIGHRAPGTAAAATATRWPSELSAEFDWLRAVFLPVALGTARLVVVDSSSAGAIFALGWLMTAVVGAAPDQPPDGRAFRRPTLGPELCLFLSWCALWLVSAA